MKTIALLTLLTIKFIDSTTNESLPAVCVKTEKKTYYSDFNGKVILPNDEQILSIGLITYSDLKNVSVKSDTTLFLNQHN
jgi:hypothetical protein